MKNKRNILILIILFLIAGKQLFAQSNFSNVLVSKTVVFYNDTAQLKFVDNKNLFAEGWDTLAQPKFWQNVICLSPDSCIINSAEKRQALCTITNEEWKCQEESEKEVYRDYLKKTYGLDDQTSINVTTGKKEFYEYKKVIPLISIASDVFVQNGVDPWYAQTILLIESPGKAAQKSSVGANGPFQLMKSVAKKYGLRVGKNIDERTDLRKAASAASKLLGNSFIPKVKELLDSKNISYNETDLWFRLLVMHAYHAGPGNVKCVIDELNPQAGGIPLFTQIWKTECRGFKNESQNYSQIALASIILFDKIINKEKDTVFMVQGDRMLAKYKKVGLSIMDANNYLNNCLHAYENDLVEGSVPFDYFFKKIGAVQKEFAYLEYKNSTKEVKKMTSRVPLSVDQFIKLGDQLLRKKKVEEAIRVFKLNVEQNPNSALAYDSLGRAYKILGKNDLALKYSNKSAALKNSQGNNE
ncbi:MAG TPA: transglycosylase SLT domain-containing protein [Bacteroidia bacterium]|nr:transglycosylase SLT domain-containing protein [Bacteroidia bacterium]